MEIQMSSRGNLVNLGNVNFNESIGEREIVGMYIYRWRISLNLNLSAGFRILSRNFFLVER